MSDVPPPPPPPSYGAPSGAPPVGVALSYGFNKYFANLGPVLGIIFVAWVAQLIPSLLQVAFDSVVLKVFFAIVGVIVGGVVSIGIYNAALMLTAGRTPTIGEAFTSDRWGEWIVFAIVYNLMVGIGLALCIVPGLLVLAYFGMAPYYFIDQHMSLGDALTASRQAASSRSYAAPVILCVLVGIAGFLACFVGALVTAPAAYIAVGFLYRSAVGQPVAP